jgi:hypothetical protein
MICGSDMVEIDQTNRFILINDGIENWTETEFMSADTIILLVDWQAETAEVVTQDNKMDSKTVRSGHKLISKYILPRNLDAHRFSECYIKTIQPLLLKMGSCFDSYWNGKNWMRRYCINGVEGKYNEDE